MSRLRVHYLHQILTVTQNLNKTFREFKVGGLGQSPWYGARVEKLVSHVRKCDHGYQTSLPKNPYILISKDICWHKHCHQNFWRNDCSSHFISMTRNKNKPFLTVHFHLFQNFLSLNWFFSFNENEKIFTKKLFTICIIKMLKKINLDGKYSIHSRSTLFMCQNHQ